MNIMGLQYLVFGVDDVDACRQYMVDYGLNPVGDGSRLEALDGTAVVILSKNEPGLPQAMGTASTLRETVYAVADEQALHAIEQELRKDREVTVGADGVLRCVDDMGFALGFQIAARRLIGLSAESINAPGDIVRRQVNQLGASKDMPALPRSLSHVVYFVPDSAKAEAFYTRLGFICTDRFQELGPFLRPAGSLDHHCLFLIQTPAFMTGIEHFTFHMGGLRRS